MTRKAGLIAGLLIALAAAAAGFLHWNDPDRRIRAVLSCGESSIEAKELDGAMSRVSLQYRDEMGLAYLNVKQVLEMAFEEFDGFDVRLQNMRIEIQKDKARVLADLEVLVVVQGQEAYLIGDREKPVPIRIALARETLLWKVRSVDGIRLLEPLIQ
jgi:hypothetical protein